MTFTSICSRGPPNTGALLALAGAPHPDQRRTHLTGEVVVPISWAEPVEHRVY